jgi:uncharacterized protein (TIGR03435 family)
VVDLPRAYGVHISHSRKKPHESGDTGTDEYWALQGYDLKAALSRVFGTQEGPFPQSRIELPSRFDASERFDFVLVFTPGQRSADRSGLMQRGIERHFKVTIGRESRMMDVYVLTAPDGQSAAIRNARDDAGSGFSAGSFSFSLPAMDDVAPTPETFRARFPTEESWRKAMTATSLSSISIANGTMEAFCKSLEDALDRPVVDETGLSGRYDIELHGDREHGGTIFKRIRDELGLMLTADRREVPFIAVRRNGS